MTENTQISPENDPLHIQSVSGLRHLAERLDILDAVNQSLAENCGCPICALEVKSSDDSSSD